MSDVSASLMHQSKRIRWTAHKLNVQAMIRKYLPCVAIVLVILIVLYLRW